MGEDAELEGERKILQNVSKLQESAAGAFAALYESPDSATTQLKAAIKRLDELVRIDDSLRETAAGLKQAAVQVDEAAYSLRDYLGKLEGDPARLDVVESRLEALDKLKRKYGKTIEEVLAFHADVAKRVDEVENATAHRAELEKQRAQAAAALREAAASEMSASERWPRRLSKQVENELKSLMMSGTQFQIKVTTGPWTATGMDEIAFLVSPNKGEELKPLEKIASGGELSRIALALKTAAGDSGKRHGISMLVFDEVDAGVGGAAAAAVGKRLKLLSKANQVICVTHLVRLRATLRIIIIQSPKRKRKAVFSPRLRNWGKVSGRERLGECFPGKTSRPASSEAGRAIDARFLGRTAEARRIRWCPR